MNLSDLITLGGDETEFFKLAKRLLSESDKKMLSDLEKCMLFSVYESFSSFVSSLSLPTGLIDSIFNEYLILRISKSRLGRKEIASLSGSLSSSTTISDMRRR